MPPQKIRLLRKQTTLNASLCIIDISLEILESKTEIFLHPDEYIYLSTLPYTNRRHSYLLGRYCAKQALSTEPFSLLPTTYAITSGIFGQPIVTAGKNIQVSIAHGDQLGAALAFPEQHPMGIDIEPINNNNLEVMQQQMTDDELKLISQYLTDETEAATLLWSAKEAISKVMRTGFMVPFTLFEIASCHIDGDYIYTQFKNFHQYQACSFKVNHHLCSIVYPRQTKMMLD